MIQDFSIIIPSNRPEMANKTKQCLQGLNCEILDGSNYPSFSKLINDCILGAKHETIIIANDKVRPTHDEIKKILFLLKKGYGFVGLYNFGFFAFTKDLIRTIGFFDERYIGGGYEDVDFGKRLLESNIGVYISDEAKYEFKPSSWNNTKAYDFHKTKWHETLYEWKRLIPDEIKYDLGELKTKPSWLPFKESIMVESSAIGHRILKKINDDFVDLSDLKSPIKL